MDIKKKIKEAGLTLDKVASKMTKTVDGKTVVGISQPSLSAIINGNPSYSKLKEIADIIGISVSQLVADEEPNTNTIKCPKCGAELTLKENVPTD